MRFLGDEEVKFKLVSNWNDRLTSECCCNLLFNHAVKAIDVRNNRELILVARDVEHYGHGENGSYRSIKIYDANNDELLDRDEFKNGFFLEVDVED